MATYLWAAYALVAGGMMVRLLASLAVLRRIRRTAATVDTLPDGTAVLEADVAVPLAVGFGRPAIVLPRRFHATAGPDELRDVLAHEAEHLQRKDHWVVLLQKLAAAAYWPIVTVHLLNRALVRAREELCDNAVLAIRDSTAYSRTLLSVAERATGRRQLAASLAPSVIWRGELERRVAAILDRRRDRRTGVGRAARWTVAASLLVAALFMGTTRWVAVAQEPSLAKPDAADAKGIAAPAPEGSIAWTGIPKIDLENPALHRGVVLGPEGKPLAGASVYAVSTIELLEMADADDVGVDDLGAVRAVTDAEGRFQFTAEDLTWVTPADERKRWEALLVATKEGLPPAWLKTWGADRNLRQHWHPRQDREVAVRMRPPASLTGRLLLEGGEPLAGARVKLTGLMAPIEYDLEKHIPKEEVNPLGLFQGVDYSEEIYRPQLLPGLKLEATADEDGQFELAGLPEGFIAYLSITHPKAVSRSLRAAVRAIEPVYRQRFHPKNGDLKAELEPTPTLYGSGFALEMPKGIVLRGQVSADIYSSSGSKKAAGVTVALANHNAKDGMSGQRFKTDAEGRFEVTGLSDRPGGFEVAFAGSFAAPYSSLRQRIAPGEEAWVALNSAAPYRLTLRNSDGDPVDREVYSVEVQEVPGTVRQGIKSRFNDAQRVAPGVYEGIVPTGPGAIFVERGKKSDRPVAVNPKEFFAPGRTDWTPEEQRFAYGDQWRIARPAVVETERLSVGHNPTTDQLELAAVVLTNAQASDGVLELTATIHTDPPVEATFVDEAGQPVSGVRVERQLKRYDAEELPATFSLYGLHPQRAEFLVFTQEQRGLIGTLSTTWTGEPIRVVMQPAATLIGRVVDASGTPNDDFSIRVFGEGVMPEKVVGGRMHQPTEKPGKRRGEFRFVVPPGAEVHGEWVRRAANQQTRSSAGAAFAPILPQPGETIHLGDLVVP